MCSPSRAIVPAAIAASTDKNDSAIHPPSPHPTIAHSPSTHPAAPTMAAEIKLFGKWTYKELNISDITLLDMIAIKEKDHVFIPHTAGRYQIKRFRKAQCPAVERLANALMRKGRNNGKKMLAMRIIQQVRPKPGGERSERGQLMACVGVEHAECDGAVDPDRSGCSPPRSIWLVAQLSAMLSAHDLLQCYYWRCKAAGAPCCAVRAAHSAPSPPSHTPSQPHTHPRDRLLRSST